VEVPHAGLRIDPEALATLVAPARSIGEDADLHVDELFADAAVEGATCLFADVSRYVCDLNRAESDVDALAAEGGAARNAPHGLVWRLTTHEETALPRPLSRAELERRIRLIYRPYHAVIQQLIEEKRAMFGHAILLSGHSMPSRGRGRGPDRGKERADVVPGSQGMTTAAAQVVLAPEIEARRMGWSVAHDDPYRGGFITGFYGQPRQGVHAVQVELSRKLYMDEGSLQKKPGAFEDTREFCRCLVAKLGRIEVASR
jgi:N-formylglutamate amidohydrolase